MQKNGQVDKINLMGMNCHTISEFFVEIGEKPFHAVQVFKWIHQRGVVDFAQMTDLSKVLRGKLDSLCTVVLPTIVSQQVSKDGTHKWSISNSVADGFIETVFIPGKNRGTLCISSQIGCTLECSFCLTGKQGFQRNLTASEIIRQVWIANQKVKHIVHSAVPSPCITNVVLMGMGEPLLNFSSVITALQVIRDDNAYALPKRRVTISTSGVVPGIDDLAACADVALALSLHAPNDKLRTQLVPLNKKYPISKVIAACKRYVKAHKRHRVTIGYVMLDGVNDSLKHAKQLVQVLEGLPCKVNLIPFNTFERAPYKCSKIETILEFSKFLIRADINTTTRARRGDDIQAACGQLVGKVLDKTRRHERWLQNLSP